MLGHLVSQQSNAHADDERGNHDLNQLDSLDGCGRLDGGEMSSLLGDGRWVIEERSGDGDDRRSA